MYANLILQLIFNLNIIFNMTSTTLNLASEVPNLTTPLKYIFFEQKKNC